MPVVVLRQVPGLMVQKTVVRPQLPSIFGRRHSFSSSRGSSPWSRLFTRPQRFRSCCSFFGRRCPCLLCRVVQVLRCCCGKDLGAPTVAARWEICALLRFPVFGSHSFGVRLQSTGFWTFLGDDIRKRFRIQRLLVQHWYVKVDLGWCSSRTRLLRCLSLLNDRCLSSAVAVLHGRLHRCFCAVADPHGSDHRDFTVAV